MFVNYLIIFLAAMLPGTELRASIPLGVIYYDLDIIITTIISILGSVVPGVFIIWGLEYFYKYIKDKNNWLARVFNFVLDRTRKRTEKKVLQYGYLALLLFVAIPLPGTGVWTGSMAAWLFGFPKKQAFVMVSLGSAIAAILVTLATIGIINII